MAGEIFGKKYIKIILFCCGSLAFLYCILYSTGTLREASFKTLKQEDVIETTPHHTGVYDTLEKTSHYEDLTDRRSAEDIMRDSIDIYHSKCFKRPVNETCERRYPTCIMIGVGKCGTRETMDFLRLNPHIEIYHRAVYEMSYFNGKYSKGDSWLKSQMPCSYSNQITIMKNAGYFHSRAVPERIKKFNETIKLILIVREPVARSISSYTFQRRNSKSRVDADTFVKDMFTANGKEIRESRSEISNSVYDKPMEFWLQYFNLSQFLILDASELKREPAVALNKVETFLGLGNFIRRNQFVLNQEKGFYCIRSNLTDTGRACYAENRGREPLILPHSKLTIMNDYFKPKNERFFKTIQKTFPWS